MIDLEQLRRDYAELETEFGEQGALTVTGINAKSPAELKEALSAENSKTAKLAEFIRSRKEGYISYSPEQQVLLLKMEHLIADSGSAANAAKSLGKSTSTVSDIRKGKYRGDVTKFFNFLAEYFSLEQERKRTKIYKPVGYVPTSVSEYIYQVIRGVHLAGDCEIITGDTGVGKTRTIKTYAADHPESTVAVTPTYADGSAAGIMKLIAEQLGISGLSRLNELTAAVLNRLHDGMLIIIDEAQHLKFPAMDQLRCLSDVFTDNGETMGVCFVGNPSIMRHFAEKKISVTGQVFNRANLRPYIQSADIKIEDIRLLFPDLAAAKKNAEIKFLYAVAQTNGEGIRRALNLYKTAYNMDGGDVSLERLAEIAQTGNLRLANIGGLLKKLKEESA